ncbi:conserved hypothetical protein [Ricinus communis]|uniref:Uncharacterized protein n=1 Tax=Ricinus communis TaxID=3988 RepID=B9TMR9_RICCO|nr:conserved hypothetical protein [Ricinus communis]
MIVRAAGTNVDANQRRLDMIPRRIHLQRMARRRGSVRRSGAVEHDVAARFHMHAAMFGQFQLTAGGMWCRLGGAGVGMHSTVRRHVVIDLLQVVVQNVSACALACPEAAVANGDMLDLDHADRLHHFHTLPAEQQFAVDIAAHRHLLAQQIRRQHQPVRRRNRRRVRALQADAALGNDAVARDQFPLRVADFTNVRLKRLFVGQLHQRTHRYLACGPAVGQQRVDADAASTTVIAAAAAIIPAATVATAIIAAATTPIIAATGAGVAGVVGRRRIIGILVVGDAAAGRFRLLQLAVILVKCGGIVRGLRIGRCRQ